MKSNEDTSGYVGHETSTTPQPNHLEVGHETPGLGSGGVLEEIAEFGLDHPILASPVFPCPHRHMTHLVHAHLL